MLSYAGKFFSRKRLAKINKYINDKNIPSTTPNIYLSYVYIFPHIFCLIHSISSRISIYIFRDISMRCRGQVFINLFSLNKTILMSPIITKCLVSFVLYINKQCYKIIWCVKSIFQLAFISNLLLYSTVSIPSYYYYYHL